MNGVRLGIEMKLGRTAKNGRNSIALDLRRCRICKHRASLKDPRRFTFTLSQEGLGGNAGCLNLLTMLDILNLCLTLLPHCCVELVAYAQPGMP